MILGAITGVPTPACLSAASNPVEAVTPPFGAGTNIALGVQRTDTSIRYVSRGSGEGNWPVQAKAITSAPAVMRRPPVIFMGDMDSPKKSQPARMTIATLSLSMGATPLTGPICNARK